MLIAKPVLIVELFAPPEVAGVPLTVNEPVGAVVSLHVKLPVDNDQPQPGALAFRREVAAECREHGAYRGLKPSQRIVTERSGSRADARL